MSEALRIAPADEPEFQAANGQILYLADSVDIGAVADGIVAEYAYGDDLQDDTEFLAWNILKGAEHLGEHHAAKIPGSAMYRYDLGGPLGATVLPQQGARIKDAPDGSRRALYFGGIVEMTVDMVDEDFIGGTRPLAMVLATRTARDEFGVNALLFRKAEDGALVGEAADEQLTRKMGKMLIALIKQPNLTKPQSSRAINIRREYEKRG